MKTLSVLGSTALLLGWMAALALCSQAAPHGEDEARTAEVDRYIAEQMAERQIPGLQLAVVKDGRLVLSRSYGVANLQTPVAVTRETRFAINSITKAFTGVAAMRLVERGKLDLAKPVGAYLDGLPEAWRAIPMVQLLTHMSGLPDIVRAPGERDLEVPAAEIWKWVEAQPMRFVPGERFEYCQTNYALVQRVINRLEGRAPDATLIDEQVKIAGMTHTGFGDSTEVVPGGAAGYRIADQKPGEPGTIRPVYEMFRPDHRAASGMVSTADDMARWLIAMDEGKLLNAASRERMWRAEKFTSGKAGFWGIGWEVLGEPGHPTVGMTGGGRSAFFLYPESRVGVVVLTNLSGAVPEDFLDGVAAIYGVALRGVPLLRSEMERRGFADGPATVEALRKKDSTLTFAEWELNEWGYRLLGATPRKALEVMRIMTRLYPESANAYDSLGEAYARSGEREKAIESYERSLALDPKNTNAEGWLQRLRGEGAQ